MHWPVTQPVAGTGRIDGTPNARLQFGVEPRGGDVVALLEGRPGQRLGFVEQGQRLNAIDAEHAIGGHLDTIDIGLQQQLTAFFGVAQVGCNGGAGLAGRQQSRRRVGSNHPPAAGHTHRFDHRRQREAA